MSCIMTATPENSNNKIITGTSISNGYAIGSAFIYRDIISTTSTINQITATSIEEEMVRINKAIEIVIQDIHEMEQQVKNTISADHAKIFTLQKDILLEEELQDELKNNLEEKLISAEQTIKNVFSKKINDLNKSENELIRSKTDDIYDIGRKVLRALMGYQNTLLEKIPENSIIVARRLLPSDTLHMQYENVKGIIVGDGSTISHTAILAKSLGIPAISGIKNPVSSIKNQEKIIIDAVSGKIIINPESKQLLEYQTIIEKEDKISKHEIAESKKKTATLDGTKISIYGNAATDRDIKLLIKNGGKGIGLLRLENFYLSQKKMPDEDILFNHFSTIFKELKHKEIVFRLLDVGGDKKIPYLHFDEENNPFLGLRGVRILLKHPKLLETQLKAAIRLSKIFHIKILIPMITVPEEIIKVKKALIKLLDKEDSAKQIPIGAMIETPAAVINIKEICKLCDFISIGTNDLIQYTMAASRDNVNVSDYFEQGAQIIKPSIHYVAKVASKHHIPCCLCGELANDKRWIKSLIKLGIREISVSPFFIPKIKSVIRDIKL